MVFGGENAESYYDEGLTASMKGDLRRASTCFKQAIRLDASFLAAYHQLAKCYHRLGKPKKAVELLSPVVARKPGLAPARLDLGYALIEVNALDQARGQFETVLALKPDNVRAQLGLAQVCFHGGDWSGALQLAQAVRVKGGANFSVLFVLGRAAKLAGNSVIAEEALDEADALMKQFIELSPGQPEGYYLRGELHFVNERFYDALGFYREAEDCAELNKYYSAFGENFTRVDVLVKRALCLQRTGEVEAAKELGHRIEALSPGHKLAQALMDL